MTMTAQIAPPNSIILVLDPECGVLPEELRGASIASTPSALVVGTLAESDGPVEVSMGGASDRPTNNDLELRWAGSLATSGRLAVLTVTQVVVLEMPAAPSAKVELWTNDENEPDLIWLVIE